jgi:hypothetical protein
MRVKVSAGVAIRGIAVLRYSFLLWRKHLIFIMMLTGALLLSLWHPPVAKGPYYLYAIVERFPVQVMPGHRNAPPPPTGAGLAQGG